MQPSRLSARGTVEREPAWAFAIHLEPGPGHPNCGGIANVTAVTISLPVARCQSRVTGTAGDSDRDGPCQRPGSGSVRVVIKFQEVPYPES